MAALPNQTNIAKVVLKQAKSTNKLVKTIFSDIKDVIESSTGSTDGLKNLMPEIKTYMEFIKSMNDIFKIFNELAGFDKDKIKNLKNIIKNTGTINGVIQAMMSSMMTLIDTMLGRPVPKKRLGAVRALSKLPGVGKLIGPEVISEWSVSSGTMEFEQDMQKLKDQAIKNVKNLLDIYKVFLGLIEDLNSSKVKMNPISTHIALAELRYAIGKINDLNRYVLDETKDINVPEVRKIIDDYISIAEGLKSMLGNITGGMLKTNKLAIKIAIGQFKSAIKKVSILIIYINKHVEARKVALAKTRVAQLVSLVSSLQTLVTALLIMVGPLALFVLVSPILALGLIVLRYFMKLLVWVAKVVRGKNVTLAIINLVKVFAKLTILAAAIVLCALAGIVVLKYWKELLVFFGALAVITLLVAGFAMLSTFLQPLMLAANALIGMMVIFMFGVLAVGLIIIAISALQIDQQKIQDAMAGITTGIIAVTEGLIDAMSPARIGAAFLALLFLPPLIIVMASIVLIAVTLLIIQNIKLSPVDIKNAVLTVLDTAQMVVDCIFDRDAIEYDKNGNASGSKKNSWIKNIFTGMGDIITAVLAVAYVALIFVSLAFILLIALMLTGLQSIKLDANAVKVAVNNIMWAAHSVMDAIFNPVEDPEKEQKSESKGWFASIISFIGGPIASVIEAVLAVAYVALVMVSLGFIYLIAKMLQGLSNIQLAPNTDEIIQNILYTARRAIDAVFNQEGETEEKTSKKGWIRKLLGWVAPSLAQIADAIMAIGVLALTFVAIGLIHVIANQLNDIQNIKLADDIVARVSNILGTARTISDKVTEQKVSKSDIKVLGRTNKYFNTFKELMHNVVEASNETVNLSQLASFAEASNRVDELIEIIKKLETLDVGVASNMRLNYMSRLSRIMHDYSDFDKNQVDQSERLLNNYIKFVDKVGGVNLENLKTATSMFEKMSQFSESISGNFEGLANSLNEKIAPLLEELKGLISGLPSKIDESTTSINNSISASSTNTNMSEDEVRGQATRNNPSASTEEINKIVDRKMSTQARAQAASITAKIDELMDILRGNGSAGPIPVRQS